MWGDRTLVGVSAPTEAILDPPMPHSLQIDVSPGPPPPKPPPRVPQKRWPRSAALQQPPKRPCNKRKAYNTAAQRLRTCRVVYPLTRNYYEHNSLKSCFAIFERFRALEMSRKHRHFQGIAREIRNFSEIIISE